MKTFFLMLDRTIGLLRPIIPQQTPSARAPLGASLLQPIRRRL